MAAETIVKFVYLDRHTGFEPEHLTQAVQVYRDAFAREPYNEYFEVDEVMATFDTILQKGNLIAAVIDDEVVGFVGGFEIEPTMSYCIDEFAVDPKRQGAGIGTKLFTEIVRKFSKEYRQLELRTSYLLTTAHRMYRRFGFVTSDKMEFMPQLRQNGKMELDKRIYMVNTFKLYRIAILNVNDTINAIIFDSDTGMDRKRLQTIIQSKWPDNQIDHFCFVALPENSNNTARIMPFTSEVDTRTLSAVTWMLSLGKNYKGVLEISSGKESTVEIDDSIIMINGVKQDHSVTILHDDPLSLK